VFKTEGGEAVVGVTQLNGLRWQLVRLQLPVRDEDEQGESSLRRSGSPRITVIPRTQNAPAPESEPVVEPEPEPVPVVEPEVARPPTPAPSLPRPSLKPAKARPDPRPEPPPAPPNEDAFAALLKSVEQLDRQVEGETVQAGRGRGQKAAGQAQRALGEAALSFSETDGLLRQIYRCWMLPVGVEGISDMMVQLRLQVRSDRTVQSVTIEDQARLGRDPLFRAVAESARRAVDKCSPLNLPPGKYAVWRDLLLSVFPADAISG
jgi:outer membrane biosynthesis protein TonB